MKEQVPKLHRQKMLHFTLHNYYFKHGLKLFFKTEKNEKNAHNVKHNENTKT